MRRLGALLTLLALAASLVAAPVGSPADAAERGDRERLTALIQQGADVNQPHPDGMTALHWAVHHDDLEATRALLKAGADTEAVNRYGVTPLSLAATNGNAAVIELLLEAGAEVSRALPGGETPLMTAARTGRIDAVRALLDAGAEASDAEEGGQTALMWAAAEGHADVVRLLLKRGADARASLTSGWTPYFFAVREGRLDAVEALLEAGVDVNAPFSPKRVNRQAPPPGSGALLLAVTNGHFELAARLLEKGADPNDATPGYTPLHRLVNVRKPGVGDNDPPPEGSGSLTSLDFVRTLVRHGADINARMSKHVDLGNTRLRREGATAFFLAAHSADAELLRVLLEQGADPEIPNEKGTTPLMAAAGIGARSPGEDAGTLEEVHEVVEFLLNLGADINAVDQDGETAMHGAAYKNAPSTVELLDARGADINIWNRENNFGWTPLTIARGYRFGNYKPSDVTVDAICKILLANGLTPDLTSIPKGREIY